MRLSHQLSFLFFLLLTPVAFVHGEVVGILPSHEQVHENSVHSTLYALEAAKAKYRYYRQIEHPRELRHLDAAIKITRKEIDAFKRRTREYRRYDRFAPGNALFVTHQYDKFELLDAELRLKDLLAERSTLHRFRGDRCLALEYDIYAARSRLRDLLGGGQVITD